MTLQKLSPLVAMALWAFLAVTSAFWFAPAAQACGTDSDCHIGDRSYRIYLPSGIDADAVSSDRRVGAIVFSHGYRGSARGAMRNGALRAVADRLGVALIAGKSLRDDWVLPGAPSDPGYDGTVELDYYDAVIADAAARFPIDARRLMATGFSAGGMMTWNLICHRGHRFAAFAPVAGVFWDPIPATCPSSPAHVIHMHGDADRIVPLEGRRIGPTTQGDVWETVKMYAAAGGFRAATLVDWEDMRCRRRTNTDGKVLELCVFEGGHDFRARRLEAAWLRFETLGAL